MWRNMSPIEKETWIEQAEDAKKLHKKKFPNYKFKPVHRRDEFGDYIRKPRRPNRRRVKKAKKADLHDKILDNHPGTFQWLEGKQAVEFPNSGLPSDASSVSSPPPSPSPPPLTTPASSSHHVVQRRPSSVPLVCPDDSFYVHSGPHSAHPCSSTGYISRRGNKRPSTSLDFMCAGLEHSEPYSFANNTEAYLSPNDHSTWRPGHRRSISAPDFGSEVTTNLTFPSHSVPQEANPLTPINPVFGNVFDRFSWNTVCSNFFSGVLREGLNLSLRSYQHHTSIKVSLKTHQLTSPRRNHSRPWITGNRVTYPWKYLNSHPTYLPQPRPPFQHQAPHKYSIPPQLPHLTLRRSKTKSTRLNLMPRLRKGGFLWTIIT